MTEFDTLLDACKVSSPDDPQSHLAAADWCGEHGMPEWEFTFRYCETRKLRPYCREITRNPWGWVCQKRSYRGLTRVQVQLRRAAVIPASIFGCLYGVRESTEWVGFRDWTSAMTQLQIALKAVRRDIEIPDLPPALNKPTNVQLVCCSGCGVSRGHWVEVCPVCKSNSVLGGSQ